MSESAESLRHANFLREMGLPVLWRRRAQAESQEVEAALPTATAAPVPQALQASMPQATPASQAVTPLVAASPMLQTAAWDDAPGTAEVNHAQVQPPTPSAQADPAILSREQAIAEMDWLQLEQAVGQCRACSLCRSRTQAVLGVGDKKAQWLLVGEGPGRTEDAVGEPFVGKSGKLLDNMLASLGLQRGRQVYIANIVKCRPTDANGNDRPPSEEEAAACRPFLERQIALLQPRLVLTLGKTAAISLLGLDAQTAVSSLRGKVQSLARSDAPALPLIATYHPAYLLRKPGDKARAWADLCLAQTTLRVVNDAG